VRELRNYIERALVLADARGASLPPPPDAQRTDGWSAPRASSPDQQPEPFKVAKERLIADFERAYLAQLMSAAAGNVTHAARIAKIDRMYLHRLLQRYDMKRVAGSE
jgi:DNA-binding NtrC family response regulator